MAWFLNRALTNFRAAVNAARDQLEADYASQMEPLRTELAEARNEIASLRARLAAAARAEADELASPSG